MVHWADLAEVGEAADGPQAASDCAALRCDRGIFGDQLQDGEVDGFRSGAKDRVVALRLEAADQRPNIREVELGVAPVDEVERPEAMLLDRRDLLVGEAAGLLGEAERSEAAVLLVPPGAP